MSTVEAIQYSGGLTSVVEAVQYGGGLTSVLTSCSNCLL